MLFRSNIFFKGLLSIFFLTYFVLGLFIYKDYGITTDEEFQRYSGFYWLNYILSFSPFEGLQLLVDRKLSSIGGFTLPNPEDYPFYGVIFDLPLALIETILKIEDPRQYFLLRHKLNFIIFFISSIYFYKIAENRFKNKSAIFFGVLIYIGSPRIFGDSFFNNKDIIFLSLITISLYYSLNLI